jgi:hypothetical protein
MKECEKVLLRDTVAGGKALEFEFLRCFTAPFL